MLPLCLQFYHEGDKMLVLSEMVQVGITFKQGITGEPIIRRHWQPLHGKLSLFHERISGSDGVSCMVKMAVVLSNFCRSLDLLLRLTVIASRSREHRLYAGETSAFVLRIIFQGLGNRCCRF